MSDGHMYLKKKIKLDLLTTNILQFQLTFKHIFHAVYRSWIWLSLQLFRQYSGGSVSYKTNQNSEQVQTYYFLTNWQIVASKKEWHPSPRIACVCMCMCWKYEILSVYSRCFANVHMNIARLTTTGATAAWTMCQG